MGHSSDFQTMVCIPLLGLPLVILGGGEEAEGGGGFQTAFLVSLCFVVRLC